MDHLVNMERVVAAKKETLKERIRRLRRERSLTLRTVADRVGGLTPAAVSHWESGRTEPTSDNLRSLAKVLGISLDELRVPTAGLPKLQRQSDENAAIDAILADAERRIAKLIGRSPGQVTVSYAVTRSS
jgi:transcriptional regulator with XRE-family HTH domain